MKNSLLLAILVLGLILPRSFASVIYLDNFQTSGPLITFGSSGIPENGVSGSTGTVGVGVPTGWTMELYRVVGNVTNSIPYDPTHIADPSTLYGALIPVSDNQAPLGVYARGEGFAGSAI